MTAVKIVFICIAQPFGGAFNTGAFLLQKNANVTPIIEVNKKIPKI